MNLKLVSFLIVIIYAQFGATKWNLMSKCSFKDSNTVVTQTCENSDKCADRSDLSCYQIGCYYPNPYRNHSDTVKTLNFENCKVPRLGVTIFDKYQLVTLDLSYMDLEELKSETFDLATSLQKLNVSHNLLSNISAALFSNAPKLDQIDLSFNKLENIDDCFDGHLSAIKSIDLSHNRIRSVDKNQTFGNLVALVELNLQHNFIETIDTNAFSANKHLKRIRLDGNKWKKFTCCGYFIIYEVNFSFNHLNKFNGKCVVRESLEVAVLKNENEDIPLIRRHNTRSKEESWTFDEDDLSEMKSLNISNSQIAGIHGIIGRLNESLKSLDVSGNCLGTLSANTFDKLINLKELVLRNTNLTTIKFGLFHHQKNLLLLDISYNNLRKIQFKAFGRNLMHLRSFYLEGNNLTEVDGLKKDLFPMVTVLGISDNNFTCEYLAYYLELWHGIELIPDQASSNHSHVEKIACDKQFIEYYVQGAVTHTTTPEMLESTVPEWIVSESTPSESTPSEWTVSESTALTSTPQPSTSSTSPIPKIISPQAQEKIDLHEKHLGNIFLVLVLLSVILSVIFIMMIVKCSITIWSSRKNGKSFELDDISLRGF